MVDYKEVDTITKEKISKMLNEKLGLSKVICDEITEQFFYEIYSIVIANKKLVIQNFGKFKINDKKARIGQNLQTKQEIVISPRKVLRFMPANNLKLMVNDGVK